MSFVRQTKQKLAEVASQIDREVSKILQTELTHAAKISSVIDSMYNLSIPMLADGGKRLRGTFLYMSYILNNGKNTAEALKITPFIELIHAYLLIHDDIMDRAKLRRGFRTIHREYEEIYKDKTHDTRGARHFGTSMGINVGDVLCHLGLLNLTQSNFSAEAKIKALTKAHRNFTDVGYGQMLDVYGSIDSVEEEDILKVHLYKTGYYTYETPLHVGAILAGAGEAELSMLTDYALPGGMAFQIVDDIIDLYGTFEQTGKIPGTDIKEGKNTLLTVKAYELANQRDKAIMESALGNPRIGKQSIELVKKIIEDTGSLEYSRDKAKKLLTESTKSLKNSYKNLNQEGIEFLTGINEYMFERMFNDENNRNKSSR